jgi:surface protein
MSFWFGTTIFSYTYTGTRDDKGGPTVTPTFNNEYNDYALSANDNGDGTVRVDVLATSMGCDIGYEYGSPYYDALYLPSKISFQGLNTVTHIEFYSAMESGFNENGLAYTVGGLTDMSDMFSGCSSLTSIEGLQYIDTSQVTTMQSMFYNCSSLTALDLSSWNTTNVTTMETMFAYCSNLPTVIGLNDLDVSNVENMGGLFSDCSNITEINVSDWNVSKVSNFGAIFRRCPKLAIIDVSKWNTSSGVIMSGIFTNDSSLIRLDLSNWDMSLADSVSQMFYGCSALMKLKMCANLNQDAVTTYWFGKCNSLNEVQLSDFDLYTINKVINELPTRTANNQGCLIVPKIDDSINTSTADSKYWIVSPDSTNIRNMHLGDIVISNLYIGEVEIKKVCLGEIIVYENKQAATGKDTLYNEFTGTLFVLKEDALSYDEEELALNINSNIIDVSYNEENLDIGGDK